MPPKTTFATPSTVPTSRPAHTKLVDDQVEKLLIRLNRSKFRSNERSSMTIVAAKGALSIFRVLVRNTETGDVVRLIKKITMISQQYFSRAPAFRFVLANVTRMVLKEVRAAGAELSRSAQQQMIADHGDLSALAAHDEDEEYDAVAEFDSSQRAAAVSDEPSSPGMRGREVSFSSFAPPPQGHGLFPRMDTHEIEPSGSAHADGGMSDPQISNASLDRAPTPLTEANIPRIQSLGNFEMYNRRLNWKNLQEKVNSAIDDISEAIESMMGTLCEHAIDHIIDNDVVLTFGSSHTTLKFLESAAEEGRSFTVFVLAAEPHGNGQSLVSVLSRYPRVTVVVMPDSECYNVMPRCSKVLLSTEGVLANGGLLAPTGSLMVCIVAKLFSVEVVVVAATLKITPYYPSDTACSSLVKLSTTEAKEMLWTTFSDPSRVLPHEHVHPVINRNGMESPLVVNPTVEYVTPEHVSIFVTDKGEFTPAFIHRYLKECFHNEDTHL